MTPLFEELRFYLAPKLSDADKTDLQQLIEQNGGVVSDTPTGATHLVNCEKLDVRHPERISTDFIKDSVAFRALQDPAQYSGKIFTTHQERRGRKKRGRIPYTLEDDARMLHFARSRDWKSMNSIPASVWRLAESDRVTIHPALSMHEHFRKQLQRKTLIEQRIIMAKAAAMIRARLLEQEADSEEEEEQEVQVVELPSRDRASPSSTGFRDAATPESTTPTQSRVSQRTPGSAGRQSAITPASTIESRLKEGEEEKFSSATRRKKTAPLRETPTQLTPATSTTPSTPASRSTPAPSASSMTPWTPGDLSSGQKRKRNTPSSGATVSQNSNASSQETGESDVESVGSKRDGGGEFGVYFRCAWAEIAQDLTKRRMLQRFFESTPAPAQHQGSSTDSVLGGASTVVFEEGDNSENSSEPLQTSAVQMEYATDEGMDDIICQLLVDTLSDMPSVAHALYYCSGDVEMARAFLKGASAPDMWSPGDDLLLANLVAEGNIDRSEVDAAVARGDFDSMQVPRDTNAILKRVQFLR
ncbi:hypothetical protein JG687_00013000 [Phytophthora cactorum]|uniref:BRCT domain-containing protein n=1 Tax=Phytophthora cactorum TaxID=29920 RepID=A0A8T1U0B8_9STRA|nr:hypothetical protein JG687_00013000 [Phytophthora cactorum]